MTSPLSLYAVIKTKRLDIFEKVFAFSGWDACFGPASIFSFFEE